MPARRPARAPSVPVTGSGRYAPEGTAPAAAAGRRAPCTYVELDRPSRTRRGALAAGRGDPGSWLSVVQRRMRPWKSTAGDCPGPPERSPRVPFLVYVGNPRAAIFARSEPGCSTRRNERSSPGREGIARNRLVSGDRSKAGPRQLLYAFFVGDIGVHPAV